MSGQPIQVAPGLAFIMPETRKVTEAIGPLLAFMVELPDSLPLGPLSAGGDLPRP